MYGLNLPFLTMGNHTPTSAATPNYNCVSHSVHEELVSLWPDDDNRWPESFPREETIEAFTRFFMALGFEEILSNEDHLESGYWKIAIYGMNEFPLHVARQLSNGRWTSKLGVLVDISHSNLHCLEGGDYGHVIKILKFKMGYAPVLPPLVPPRPLIIMP
jgi:hypothetical protein